ncbi:hypothetical protein N7451_008878 [Penicillium sp. IBT 35674x]|nr:hypothetical protein N7451_008878 [Penicillium sp. IBT 35674x]
MSSAQENGGTMPPLPSTRLPHFNITQQNVSARIYHKVTMNACLIVSDTETLLRRFALFVCAVVEADHVVFAADTMGSWTLVDAKIPATAIVKLQHVSLRDVDADLNEFHFAIRIVRDNDIDTMDVRPIDKLPQPFTLSVDLTRCGDLADLILTFDRHYGPPVAAQHLLRLVASYIGTGSSDNGTESSLIAAAPPQRDSLLAQKSLMHEWVEESAHHRPDNIAFEHLTRTAASPYQLRDITYEELDTRANRLADAVNIIIQTLNWKPIQKDQCVIPLFLPSCPDFFVAVLGIQKAGHAFCSLPIDAPPERLKVLIDDLQAPAVFGLGCCPYIGRELSDVVWLDLSVQESWPTVVSAPDVPQLPRRAITGDDLAYLLYTSGSTGRPKGVLISHVAGTAFLNGMAERLAHLSTGPRLRWFATSQPFFDAIILEMFIPLAMGGTVCTAERDLMLTDVGATLNELRATVTFFVPSLAMLLKPSDIPTLKTVCVGGEMLTQRVMENFAPSREGVLSDRYFLNLYGPTEATVWVSSQGCTTATRRSVVGGLFPQMFAVIIDAKSDKPYEVSLGLSGELTLGGPQLALGYLNRPHETTKAFVYHPKLGRLYRTGDKARIVWTEDGQPKIDLLGRFSSDQVKLNGRRLEMFEIETVLASVQGVAEASVVVVENQLIAFLVEWVGSTILATNIESQCRLEAERRIPAWMRPKQYFILRSLPRTAAGKVDRKPLASMAAAQLTGKTAIQKVTPKDTTPLWSATTDSKAAVLSPASPGEGIHGESYGAKAALLGSQGISSLVYQALAAIFNDVKILDRERSTSLLSLGFDSLGAMLFIQKLRNTGMGTLPIQDVLSATTIDELVKIAEISCRITPANGTGESVAPRGGYHLSRYNVATKAEFLDQDRYWGKPEVDHFVYEAPEGMDSKRLQRAVDTVLRRYDCFRAVFVPVRHPLSTFAQCILEPSAAKASVVKMTCSPHHYERPDSLWQRTVVGAQRAAEEAMRLDRPGVTVSYILSPDSSLCVLVMSLFHAIFDGASLMYLREAIATEYANPGTAPPVAYLPSRTAVETIMKTDWTTTMLYWMTRFANVPVFRLGSACPIPLARPLFPPDVYCRGETHMRSLYVTSQLTLTALSSRAYSMSITLISVVESALASVLAQTQIHSAKAECKDRLDIQFGCIMSGRQTEAARRCMAAMMAIMPVHVIFNRNDSGPVHTNREMCQMLATQHLESSPYIQAPCPTLDLAELAMNRFDTFLNVHTYLSNTEDPLVVRDLPGFTAEENLRAPFKEVDTGLPLLFELWPSRGRWDEKIRWKVVYNTRRPGYEFLTEEWVTSALVSLDEAVQRIIDTPDDTFH